MENSSNSKQLILNFKTLKFLTGHNFWLGKTPAEKFIFSKNQGTEPEASPKMLTQWYFLWNLSCFRRNYFNLIRDILESKGSIR